MTEKTRVLVVEDDQHIRQELGDVLRGNGFAVDACSGYREAKQQLASGDFALLLLDLWLPDGDGLDLCKELRQDNDPLPVIIVTSRNRPDEIARGLDLGADDYVVKPFQVPELLARIRSTLRRASPQHGLSTLTAGPIKLDRSTRRAWIDDRELSLKPKEFQLLACFLRSPGRVWTRGQLLTKVWGPLFDGDERTVDIHVARLRSVLETNPRNPNWIKTVWRVGYRFSEDGT